VLALIERSTLLMVVDGNEPSAEGTDEAGSSGRSYGVRSRAIQTSAPATPQMISKHPMMKGPA
jgi:hypothetical protein